jgi:hypothetical protein
MKRHIVNYFLIIIVFLAMMGMVSAYANGQQKKGDTSASGDNGKVRLKPLPDGGPAPRASDGHPDLSGHWFVGLLGTEGADYFGADGELDPAARAFDPKVTPEERLSYQPWAIAKIKEMRFGLDESILRAYANGTAGAVNYVRLPKETQIALIDNEIANRSKNCLPRGVPAIFSGGGHGIQLVQTPGQLVLLAESNHDWRLVPTDGRPHTKDPDPAFNGEGVGRWEGDTLVIDTIAIDEKVGTFHSDQEHVIERISRPSMNYLNYQYTIEDPKVLTKTWNSVVHHFSLSHEPLIEWYCGVDPHEDQATIQALQERKKELFDKK